MMNFLWIDYAIVGLIIIFGMLGIIRGFASELFASLVWLIAIIVSLNFSKEFALFLGRFFNSGMTHNVPLAMLLLSLLTLTLGVVIAWLLGDLIGIQGFKLLSRLMGMIVGFFRAIVALTLFTLFSGMTSLPKETWWQESELIHPLQRLAIELRNHASRGVAESINYK